MAIERQQFPGVRPMTWVYVNDPLWERLSNKWLKDQQELEKQGKLTKEGGIGAQRPPITFWSKHVKNSTGPGWMFPTSWVQALEVQDVQDAADGLRPFYYDGKPKVRDILLRSTAVRPDVVPEPWPPIPADLLSVTLGAMERRWSKGVLQRHEWVPYIETLKATAAVLPEGDPDRVRCLLLADHIESQAKLSDAGFVRKAMSWSG